MTPIKRKIYNWIPNAIEADQNRKDFLKGLYERGAEKYKSLAKTLYKDGKEVAEENKEKPEKKDI